jgi:hypothetical protein
MNTQCRYYWMQSRNFAPSNLARTVCPASPDLAVPVAVFSAETELQASLPLIFHPPFSGSWHLSVPIAQGVKNR